jgi:proline dehydrogenase
MEKKKLTAEEQEEWDKVVARFDLVCSEASKNNVSLLIDGEESWMQDAADEWLLI